MHGLKIESLNVWGLADNCKCKQMFNYFKCREVDVLMLQETHSVENIEKNVACLEWGGEMFLPHGDSNARGVLIAFRKDLLSLNQ